MIFSTCSHFGICGGCQFQNVPYLDQLEKKEALIKELFGIQPLPILPCTPHWRYRNKMEFSFSQAKDGKKFLGLMQKKSRGKVVILQECFLTNEWFIDILKKVFNWWQNGPLTAYRPLSNSGLLRTLTLREGFYTKEKMAVITVSGKEFAAFEPYIEEFISLFPDLDAIVLRKQFVEKGVPTYFEEVTLAKKNYIYECLHDPKKGQKRFKIYASSFFQPNTRQAEILLSRAVSHVLGDTVFDLYCGGGAIGILAADFAKKVIGIDISKENIESAKENIRENQITNMEVFLGDVEKTLPLLNLTADTIIVDPPRCGLSPKTIETIRQLNPKKVIYISCNPVTQAANCKDLRYKVDSLQPVDQFPHTHHLENIAVLSR